MGVVLLFIYLWLSWVFVAVRGPSLAVASGGCSLVLECGLIIEVASLFAEHRLEGAWTSVVAVCGLSSCGART